jgi:hypothetical protein
MGHLMNDVHGSEIFSTLGIVTPICSWCVRVLDSSDDNTAGETILSFATSSVRKLTSVRATNASTVKLASYKLPKATIHWLI